MAITRVQQKQKYMRDSRYHTNADSFSNGYSYSWRSYHGLYFDLKRIEELVTLLNKHKVVLKNSKVLDIGCHYGLFANVFAYLKRSLRNYQLSKLRAPFWLIGIFGLILPHHYTLALLQKK